MNTALIAITGVLRKTIGNSPINEGVRLYSSLCATGRVILTDPSPDGEHEQVRDWLELNGCVNHDFIEWAVPVDAANHLRRVGYPWIWCSCPTPSRPGL